MGIYTLTFEIEFYNTFGQQYARTKQYEIFVAPMPTVVYADGYNNKLFYWVGNDNMLNKPGFLVEGYDPQNTTVPEINYMLGYDLIDLARSQGYDIFIMEWADGGKDITLNKDVFIGACQFIHNLLGNTEAAIQVVGISMGGVIGRYGLAWAEDDINPNGHPGQYIDHFVNTFISFDSPQQGAHLNMGLQNVIKNNGSTTQQDAIKAKAAKQMLYDNVYGSLYSNFYNDLKGLNNKPIFTNGYPRRCKNFAISNGNRSTNYPNKSTSDPLATIKIHFNVNLSNIITIPAAQFTFNVNAEERDIFPGSTFTGDLTTLYAQGFKYIGKLGWGPFFVEGGGAWRFQVNFNPGYIPTESGIDLDGYTRSANGSLISGSSWFQDTLTQITFKRHEELTNESKNKVMEWLNNNRTHPYLGRPSSISVPTVSPGPVLIIFKDESAYEDGHKIERKIEGGTYSEIATLGPNQNQYFDNDASKQAFKTYYYRVRSFSGSNFSPYSEAVTVYIKPHLASTSSSATANNNQRKIVRDNAGVYHLVYE